MTIINKNLCTAYDGLLSVDYSYNDDPAELLSISARNDDAQPHFIHMLAENTQVTYDATIDANTTVEQIIPIEISDTMGLTIHPVHGLDGLNTSIG